MTKDKTLKNENLVISDYYDSLTDEQKTSFRNQVMAAMEISLATFYYRLRNNGFKGIERQYIINKLIEKQC